jgi:hypothetical protein
MPINITMTSFSDRLAQRDDYALPTETRPDPLAQAQSLLQRPTATFVEMPEDQGMVRRDGTMKSEEGFLGPIKDEFGRTMTEYSIGIPIRQPDGSEKEMDVPSLVPGLTQEEIDILKKDPEDLPESIRIKAAKHAEERLKEGKSVFFSEEDKVTTQGVDLSEEPIQSKTIYDDRNVATDDGKAVATPEGIYNNPGNIERSGDKWYGMVEDKGYGKNERFAVFDTPQLGVRAMIKTLRTKIKRFDGNLKEIINEYAPNSENDTKAYIANVKKILGNKDIVTEDDLKTLAKAVITVENSPKLRDYYLKDTKILDEAYELSKENL